MYIYLLEYLFVSNLLLNIYIYLRSLHMMIHKDNNFQVRQRIQEDQTIRQSFLASSYQSQLIPIDGNKSAILLNKCILTRDVTFRLKVGIPFHKLGFYCMQI